MSILGKTKSKHHLTLIFGVVIVFISIILTIISLRGSNITQTDIIQNTKSQPQNVPEVSIKTDTSSAKFQAKNYNDYGLSFSIPSSWFESENTVTPNLFLTFKKTDIADIGVSTSKSFVGHGVAGEMLSKEKITVSNIEGEIQIWDDPGKIRTVIVNNLKKNGLYYTFEIFIYQDFEVSETEFRDFLKTISFR